jgi:hypothetical protein
MGQSSPLVHTPTISAAIPVERLPSAPLSPGATAAKPPPDATLLQQLQWSEDRRAAAEQRIQELTALASKLQSRLDAITTAGGLDALKPPPPPSTEREDGIDRFIRQYLKEHPDYKVQVKKLAPNFYQFGDSGKVYVAKRGEHCVVRVGGGYKSLITYMDERVLYTRGKI